jgi:hypothetical protein
MTPSHVKKYPKSAKGPFSVYVRKDVAALDPLQLQTQVFSLYKSCTKAFCVNDSKIRLTFTNVDEANAIVENESFTGKYKLYVPAKDVEIQGIVSISVDCSADKLKEAKGKFSARGMDPVNVIDSYRLPEKDTEEPSNRVKVTFEGPVLPDYLSFDDRLDLKVRPYFPKVFFCSKCLDYGHTVNYCTRFKQKCAKCSGDHAQEQCLVPDPTCRHCKGSHETGSKDCPTLRKVQERKRTEYETRLQNQFDLLATHVEMVEEPVESVDTELVAPSHSRKRRRVNPVSSRGSLPRSQRTSRSFAEVVAGPSRQEPRTSVQSVPPSSEGQRRSQSSKAGGLSIFYQIVSSILLGLGVPESTRKWLLNVITPVVEIIWAQLSSKFFGGAGQTTNYA